MGDVPEYDFWTTLSESGLKHNFRFARHSGANCQGWYAATWNFVSDRRFKTESGLLPDVPRGTHCEDTFVAAGEQHPFQKAAALIVEEIFEPSVLHQLRDDDHNAPTGILFREIENKLNHRNDDEAVG
jgi:hypothetical protein